MGSINYYRKFIPDLAHPMIPFQKILAKSEKNLVWGDQQNTSYNIIQGFLKNKM